MMLWCLLLHSSNGKSVTWAQNEKGTRGNHLWKRLSFHIKKRESNQTAVIKPFSKTSESRYGGDITPESGAKMLYEVAEAEEHYPVTYRPQTPSPISTVSQRAASLVCGPEDPAVPSYLSEQPQRSGSSQGSLMDQISCVVNRFTANISELNSMMLLPGPSGTGAPSDPCPPALPHPPRDPAAHHHDHLCRGAARAHPGGQRLPSGCRQNVGRRRQRCHLGVLGHQDRPGGAGGPDAALAFPGIPSIRAVPRPHRLCPSRPSASRPPPSMTDWCCEITARAPPPCEEHRQVRGGGWGKSCETPLWTKVGKRWQCDDGSTWQQQEQRAYCVFYVYNSFGSWSRGDRQRWPNQTDEATDEKALAFLYGLEKE